MQRLGLLAMLLLLALSACRKNVDDVIITEDPYLPHVIEFEPDVSIIQGSLTGFVVDAEGEPVENAQVELGNLQTTTDDYGHFFFQNIEMNSKGQFVTVNKTGFFEGSRRFFPLAGEESRIKIQMLPKSFNNSFESQVGATIETSGAQVIFPANAIQTESGDAYTGSVLVAAFWMDPSSPDILEQMPGNLQGISTSADEVALATYGMIAVELQSPTGQKLNIAEGSKATLSMPIPASMQATAPDVMPLWSFYNGYGLWVEEGEATREGDRYVGEVSHFSFWNCDLPYTYADFNAQVVSTSGAPLVNMKVLLRLTNGTLVGYDYTDADGNMTGKLPEGVELVLEISDVCGELVYTENIGPFTGVVDLGTIEVDPSGSETGIAGEAENCDGEPVENGLAIVNLGNFLSYHYFTNGSFDISLLTCIGTPEVELTLVDLDDVYQNDPVLLATNEQHDLGSVTVCDQQVEFYFILTVDGNTTEYLLPNAEVITIDSFGDIQTFIYINTQDVSFNGQFAGGAVGDYTTANGLHSIYSQINDWNLEGVFETEFIVHEYGDVGEPVRATFSGTLLNDSPAGTFLMDVSGEFRLNRTE